MVSKRTSKLVKSLQQKKYRKKYELFLVEGDKLVRELLASSHSIQTLIGTPVFLEAIKDHPKLQQISEITATDAKALSALSHLKNNHTALAVVNMPSPPIYQAPRENYVLVLDDVKDPGNLGTILRIADWYGLHQIICSPETTDLYNPKVISASMGSFLRISVLYQPLLDFLQENELPVFGAYAKEGTNVHRANFTGSGILLMGSESHGINPSLDEFVHHKINIPTYGQAESLNVSVATAIICDNLRRVISKK